MYDKKQKTTVGCYDRKPVSDRYKHRISGFKKALTKKQTAAEVNFQQHIADLIACECGTSFVAQREFFITDEIAFIADFYFKKFKVAVEIDGPNHNKDRERQRDKWRDGLLLEHAGVSVIRFTNKEALTQTEAVYKRLIHFLAEAPNATASHRKHLRKIYAHLFY